MAPATKREALTLAPNEKAKCVSLAPSLSHSSLNVAVAAVGAALGLAVTAGVGLAALRAHKNALIFQNADAKSNVALCVWKSNPAGYQSPADFGVKEFEQMDFKKRDDAPAVGMFLSHRNPIARKNPTVVFFGGVRRNVGRLLPLITRIYDRVGCNVLAFDHRGFGASRGEPSQKKLYEDAEDVMDFAMTHMKPSIDPNNIFVHGFSMGSAAALHVASHSKWRDKIRGLILHSPFTNMHEAATWANPPLRSLPQTAIDFILGDERFDNTEKVKQVTCPVMIVSGDRDSVCPHEMSKTLYNICPSKHKTFGVLCGGGHRNFEYVRYFFDKYKNFIQNPKKSTYWKLNSSLVDPSDVVNLLPSLEADNPPPDEVLPSDDTSDQTSELPGKEEVSKSQEEPITKQKQGAPLDEAATLEGVDSALQALNREVAAEETKDEAPEVSLNQLHSDHERPVKKASCDGSTGLDSNGNSGEDIQADGNATTDENPEPSEPGLDDEVNQDSEGVDAVEESLDGEDGIEDSSDGEDEIEDSSDGEDEIEDSRAADDATEDSLEEMAEEGS